MSLIGVVKVAEAQNSQIKQAVAKVLKLINFQFPKNVKNVVIKPNLCYYWDYSTGQTTDPRFIGTLAEIIRERIRSDANISVVESDASAMKCAYAFRVLGYERLAGQKNVNLVNLSKDKVEKVQTTVNGRIVTLYMPETIKNADLRINIPKIKYMTQTKISCALKNIFGCNPIPTKYKFHPQLSETIVALNKIMKFHLHILDGIVVPTTPPKRLNLIMASQDPVAFDSAASRIAGINPRTVKHIMLAQKEGLGTTNYKPIGADLYAFSEQFPKRKLTTRFLTQAYTLATKMKLLSTDAF